MIPTSYYVLLSAVLFALGVVGVLTRRNALIVFMSVEMMLNSANLAVFYKELRDFGYVEGQNLIIEYRSADGRNERLPGLVSELLRLNVDLIVVRGTPEVLAIKNATARFQWSCPPL